MSFENWSGLYKFLYTFRFLRWARIFILSWYLAWDIELEILSTIHCESSFPPFRNAPLTWFVILLCFAFERVPHSTPRAKLVETMCLKVLLALVYASSVGIPSSANVIRGSFFFSSSFFRSSFSFLMASLSSFLLFFSRVLGERAPIVVLSSLFLFFSITLASAAFLASSSLYASPIVNPACNAWTKMVVKDANPSSVLVSIANSSEALKWSTIVFLNLSSFLSPPPDPEWRTPKSRGEPTWGFTKV